MVNHGLSTGALFLLVGLDLRAPPHPPDHRAAAACRRSAPIFAAVFTVVMLSSIGLPGLNGFVGEFLILIGTFLTHRWWAVVAAAGVILAALYLLWAYQRVFHGEPDEDNATFPDLKLARGPGHGAAHRPHRVPRRLPQAGARPHRARRSTASSRHVERAPADRQPPVADRPAERRGDPRRRRADAARPAPARRSARPAVELVRARRRCSSWSAAPLLLLVVGALHAALAAGPGYALVTVAGGRRRRRRCRSSLWDDVTDHGPADARRRRARVRRLRRVHHRSRSAPRVILAALTPTATCAARASTGPSSTSCASSPRRRHGDGVRPTT